MGSLKDFVESYLANKKIEDYEGWVSKYGKDASSSYAEALSSAERTYARGQATYGRVASDLQSKGLTGSGYSAYLSGKAYERYAGSREAALTAKQKTEDDNRIRYASYREERETAAREEGEGAFRKALSSLFSSKIVDEESGAAYLAAFGITGEMAKEMAKINQSVKSGSEYRDEVFNFCLENYYNHDQTVAYAIGLGLSAEEAEALGKAVETIRSTGTNYGR